MKIKAFPLGIYMANCYLVWQENKEASIFDCGDSNFQDLISFIKEKELCVKNIILTHGHGDHIGGINELVKIFPEATVYIGEEEAEFLINPKLSLSEAIHGKEFIYNGKFKTLKEGDSIFGFKVIDTPGHTIGSKCFYNKENKIMITGDTLFKDSYGRYDLPTGNLVQLRESLKKICEDYPEDTMVYSGHTEPTTLGDERIKLKRQRMI